MEERSSQQLVGGFNRRQASAVSAVYDKYQEYTFDMASTLVHHHPDATDLAAEAFLALLERKERFESIDAIRGFLYNNVRNACYDYLRHGRIARRKLDELAYHQTLIQDDRADKETRQAWRQIILQSIELLPAKTRQVLMLHFNEELNTRQIALRLGMSEKTVSNQKSDGLKRLKAIMQASGTSFIIILFLLS
ncbi:MAG TPA: sigma-70 family RNA polymerase sigma factor [Puia sp.]|nr:sigma-70 family RNA polymerase sigma factor [Puia sp.]